MNRARLARWKRKPTNKQEAEVSFRIWKEELEFDEGDLLGGTNNSRSLCGLCNLITLILFPILSLSIFIFLSLCVYLCRTGRDKADTCSTQCLLLLLLFVFVLFFCLLFLPSSLRVKVEKKKHQRGEIEGEYQRLLLPVVVRLHFWKKQNSRNIYKKRNTCFVGYIQQQDIRERDP